MDRLSQDTSGATQPTPFLKWAGGKWSLLSQLAPLFPTEYGKYHEPFIGGGAVFLHLRPKAAVINDLNTTLVNCYRAVQSSVEQVIERLETLRAAHGHDHYYEMRWRYNHEKRLGSIERAAIHIYLNKTCYNGLYRVNRKGHFNVPAGRYKNPRIFSADNLRQVSRTLRGTRIENTSFEGLLEWTEPGDFVYLDPPYLPVSSTANFTSYTAGGFDHAAQIRLAAVCRELDARGVYFMLSNSAAQEVTRLYSGFEIHTVSARRRINSNAARRGPVDEYVVCNYTATRRPGRSMPSRPRITTSDV